MHPFHWWGPLTCCDKRVRLAALLAVLPPATLHYPLPLHPLQQQLQPTTNETFLDIFVSLSLLLEIFEINTSRFRGGPGWHGMEALVFSFTLCPTCSAFTLLCPGANTPSMQHKHRTRAHNHQHVSTWQVHWTHSRPCESACICC